MAQCSADFEKGTNGSNILAADPGSATAWNTMDVLSGNTLTYDNTHAAHGAMAMKANNSAAPASDCTAQWTTSLGTLTDWYGRLYAYCTANPAVDFRLSKDLSVAGNRLSITSAGKIQVLDASSSQAVLTTNAISLNQWVRIEWHVTHSATVGQWEVKLFNTIDSTTPTETVTSAANLNTGTGTSSGWAFGLYAGSSSGTVWLDDIVAGATSYPGPAFVFSYTANTFLNDSNDGPVGAPVLAQLQALDNAIAASGSGYVAQTWGNDQFAGNLGPAMLARLNSMSAALANPGAHYTALGFPNNEHFGILGPDMRSKLTSMENAIATLRP